MPDAQAIKPKAKTPGEHGDSHVATEQSSSSGHTSPPTISPLEVTTINGESQF